MSIGTPLAVFVVISSGENRDLPVLVADIPKTTTDELAGGVLVECSDSLARNGVTWRIFSAVALSAWKPIRTGEIAQPA